MNSIYAVALMWLAMQQAPTEWELWKASSGILVILALCLMFGIATMPRKRRCTFTNNWGTCGKKQDAACHENWRGGLPSLKHHKFTVQ